MCVTVERCLWNEPRWEILCDFSHQRGLVDVLQASIHRHKIVRWFAVSDSNLKLGGDMIRTHSLAKHQEYVDPGAKVLDSIPKRDYAGAFREQIGLECLVQLSPHYANELLLQF